MIWNRCSSSFHWTDPSSKSAKSSPRLLRVKEDPNELLVFECLHFWGAHTLGDIINIWVWVNTYRYIFSGMNIHLPAILGFTRGTRFWHTAIWVCLKTRYTYRYTVYTLQAGCFMVIFEVKDDYTPLFCHLPLSFDTAICCGLGHHPNASGYHFGRQDPLHFSSGENCASRPRGWRNTVKKTPGQRSFLRSFRYFHSIPAKFSKDTNSEK